MNTDTADPRRDDVTLQFLGASGTVTGSRYLVETCGRRVLVDCGLFQGYKQLRLRNWAPFPVDPASIDAVVLTHAHLDHSGYLPVLVRNGFKGAIHCTGATRELCGLLWPDSARLLEEEAEFAARHGYSRHASPRPLYTEADAQVALSRVKPHAFYHDIPLCPGFFARFLPAGHLLGAAQISLTADGRRLHFSGDVGRPDDALTMPPAPLPYCDVLVCESTYGNRRHPPIDPEEELGDVVRRVAGRGGVLVIPAFAVGRAQLLLLHLLRLRKRGAIPAVPVFLNSPMAVDATQIYQRFSSEHRITRAECDEISRHVTYVNTVPESKALNHRRGPMVIVSASGMATGGRVLHHLEAFGPHERNAIALGGFQAGGTRGAALASGAKTLRMFGRDVPIRAEVVQLRSFSSHADGDELLAWMGSARSRPSTVYVTHGEPEPADVLRGRIEHELRWRARVPEQLERVTIDGQQTRPGPAADEDEQPLGQPGGAAATSAA